MAMRNVSGAAVRRATVALAAVLLCACAADAPAERERDDGSSAPGVRGPEGASGANVAGSAAAGRGGAAAGAPNPSGGSSGTGVAGRSGSTPGPGGAGAQPGVETNVGPNDPLLGGSAPGSGGPGCHKVDFLFVIDNSGSMQDEQQNLINSFPGFITTIRDTVAAEDHNIMVVDTDASEGGGGSSTTCTNNVCTCSPAPACCDQLCALGVTMSCNGFACGALPPADDCNATLGAGKIFRHDGTRCLTGDKPRYMTESDPELETHFGCVAQVGTSGDGNEQPMAAMLQALGPQAQPGACNEGFLRSDAILVVTFITDEEDLVGKSPGDPASWAAELTALKNGNQNAIVVLGVFGDSDRAGSVCPAGGLVDDLGAEPGYRLREFVERFNYGVAGSVCAPDYAPLLTEAVAVIDTACDEFVQ